jgi:hypothetical protein
MAMLWVAVLGVDLAAASRFPGSVRMSAVWSAHAAPFLFFVLYVPGQADVVLASVWMIAEIAAIASLINRSP